ncbi:hypothetical protein [Actinoplanes sp. NPDC023714]|uniref:hypothetical protein n=1 Tax=Actinoplanes sp. NPDC023714 TaxID=3154322 RepID=UPI003410F910
MSQPEPLISGYPARPQTTRRLVEPLAARLIGRRPLRSRPRPMNDMWIAACRLTYDLPLATLNLRDYQDFREHHGLRILGTT